MRTTKRIKAAALTGLITLVATIVAGAEKPGPSPPRLVEAKTIFVTCPGGACDADVEESAYRALIVWGKYKVVQARADADLILLFSWDDSKYLGEYLGALPTGGAVFVPIRSTWWHAQIIDTRDNSRIWGESMEYAGSPQSTTRFLIHKLKRRINKL